MNFSSKDLKKLDDRELSTLLTLIVEEYRDRVRKHKLSKYDKTTLIVDARNLLTVAIQIP